ncbi:RHS repeat-associated core domain-containing protein [Pseudomonas peradeniyensis]|nr:RHS repeat-associated core domain-containing protein [Pseudomonas peradeniyensis]
MIDKSSVCTCTRHLVIDRQKSILRGLGTGSGHCIAYTPFGYDPTDKLSSMHLGYDGYPRTPLIGHYLLGNGHRAFIASLMRFVSPDRLSPFGKGGINAYAYCRNDPVNYRDDSGRIPIRDINIRIYNVSLSPRALEQDFFSQFPNWKAIAKKDKLSKSEIKLIKSIPKKVADLIRASDYSRATGYIYTEEDLNTLLDINWGVNRLSSLVTPTPLDASVRTAVGAAVTTPEGVQTISLSAADTGANSNMNNSIRSNTTHPEPPPPSYADTIAPQNT